MEKQIESFEQHDRFSERLSYENRRLWEEFPTLAANCIDPHLSINPNFISNPDDPQEHDTEWHQFGILTHTKKFVEIIDEICPEILQQIDRWNMIETMLNKPIDGKTKFELLKSAAILHDIGKFARGEKTSKEGKLKANYGGHEKLSKDIILHKIDNQLQKIGFTSDQIGYIADCAGLHYELARRIRDVGKRTPGGFTSEFVRSRACIEECKNISEENFPYRVEIGLLYLADSLSKTDPILQRDPEVQISKLHLSPNMINAVKQVPVNTELSKVYFQQLLDSAPSPEFKYEKPVAEFRVDDKGNHYFSYDIKKPDVLVPENNLKNRGEWHITIIRPPEYDKVSKEHPEVIDKNVTFNTMPQFLGIGKAVEDKNAAYFMAANWPEAQEFRQNLGLSHHDFHVTLGFREKDIHNVPKDESSLITFFTNNNKNK